MARRRPRPLTHSPAPKHPPSVPLRTAPALELQRALQEALPEAKLPHSTVLTSPTPLLSALGYVRIALWCAAQLRPHLSTEELEINDQMISAVESFLHEPQSLDVCSKLLFTARLGPQKRTPKAVQLGDLTLSWPRPPRWIRPEEGAIFAASIATSMAYRFARGEPISIGHRQGAFIWCRDHASKCVISTAEMLMAKKVSLTGFAEGLEQAVAAAECQERLQNVNRGTLRVDRVIWRAADKRAYAEHFLFSLRPSGYAVITKTKGRWQIHEGGAQEALACLSDQHFDAGLRAFYEAQKKR